VIADLARGNRLAASRPTGELVLVGDVANLRRALGPTGVQRSGRA